MKKLVFLTLLSFILVACGQTTVNNPSTQESTSTPNQADLPAYAVATMPTPVLYTPDFSAVFGGEDGKTLKFDDYGEIDELEFVALEGTAFQIKKALPQADGNIIYQVESEDYPYETEKGYYVDSRFVKTTDQKPSDRVKTLPSPEEITANLLEAEGSTYTWGGNYRQGIESLLSFYPPKGELSQELKDQWMLKGVDCSGLLYEATGGSTPRNTSDLLEYGKGIEIAGKKADEIAPLLQPLDLIVWKGHMIIVLEDGRTIESKADYDEEAEGFQGGVKIRTVQEVLAEAMETRVPVNNYEDEAGKDEAGEDKKKFVVRRWI